MIETIIINSWWLALCIYHEARGEDQLAQIGVAHTVMNRVVERGLSVKEVIQQERQFSWYERGMTLEIREPEVFEHCILMAKQCLEQRMNGELFGGVNHFYDISIPEPRWARNMVFVGQFGKMRFYKG